MSTAASAILTPAVSVETRGRVRAGTVVTGIAIALGFAMATVRPGLAQWVNDEPKLIHNALLMNEQGTLATKGLLGSLDIAYGPAPIWFYQFLLSITHQIAWVVTLHAIAFFGATIGAALWLAREAKLPVAFVSILALCPSICFYSRQMWDNPFNIPLSIVLVACYMRVLNTRSLAFAAILGAIAVLMLSVHLAAAPLIGAIGIHALWRERPTLKRASLATAVGVLAMTIPFIPYIQSQLPIALKHAPKPEREQQGLLPGYPYSLENQGPIRSIAYAFFGTRTVSADFSTMPRFETGSLGWAHRAARVPSWIVHAMFATGIAITLFQFLPRRQKGDDQAAASFQSQIVNRQSQIALVALLTLFLQAALFLWMRPMPVEHYFNAAFVVYPLLAWTALDRLPWANLLVTLAAVGVGVSTALNLLYLHQVGGSQKGYGPTLEQQQVLLADLRQRGVSEFQTNVVHFSYFPQGLRTLYRLSDAPAGSSSELPYVTEIRPESGKLMVLPAARAEPDVVRFDLAANVPWLQ